MKFAPPQLRQVTVDGSRIAADQQQFGLVDQTGRGVFQHPIVDVGPTVALLRDEQPGGRPIAKTPVGAHPIPVGFCLPSPIWSNHKSCEFCRNVSMAFDRTATRNRSGRNCFGSTRPSRSVPRPVHSSRDRRAWPGSGIPDRARTCVGQYRAVADTRHHLGRGSTTRRIVPPTARYKELPRGPLEPAAVWRPRSTGDFLYTDALPGERDRRCCVRSR